MRKSSLLILGALTAPFVVPVAAGADAQAADYVVLYTEGVDVAAARVAVEAAGGTIVAENLAIGTATVTTSNASFITDVAAAAAIEGAARNRPIGSVPAQQPKLTEIEDLQAEIAAAGGLDAITAAAAAAEDVEAEPLADLQWGMEMIHATAEGSYSVQTGSHDVIVGIIDTGVDGSHPDIAPNFDASLSRNFTVDIPLVDGACEEDPDGSCNDPADVDENGHGTHVAGIVGAALNGIGVAGVAPGVRLVNLRAGQDSGFFFLQPTLDAYTFAAENGVDVVNMSYFTDPWLYNCNNNPADSHAESIEQRTIVSATQRAVRYGRDNGVTFVAALGNGHTDLGNPTVDTISPDFPPGTERTRVIDNRCITVPTETRGVISVSSIGPSQKKSDFSDYGIEQTDVSAPGGWFRDFFGTDRFMTPENLILSAYPESLGAVEGTIDPVTGLPLTPFVVADCDAAGECAYYQYLQGTSMASPHAAGVVALIVSEYGRPDPNHGGLTLSPGAAQRILYATATDHACPDPPLQSYVQEGRPVEFDALCVGGPEDNGFYGNGIVDALAAVTAF